MMMFLLMILPVIGFSQTEKGNWLLGGSATFSSVKYKGATERQTSYTFAPNAGYFLTKNVVVGLDLNLNHVNKNTVFLNVNPFGRYYWHKTFIQAKYLSTSGKYSDNGYDLSIGRAFFLKPNVAFEPEFYYQNVTGYQDHDNFGLRMGMQFYW